MAKRRQKLQFKVVLDTNAIWTGGESYLLRREMSDLVDTNRGDAHLAIEWILPEVVLRERLYQMKREAVSLLPSLARLERVIGHPLNITEEVISDRISDAVNRQVQHLQLIVHPASYDRVDWLRLVGDAVDRRAPFEGKSEKGFRDAIIAETFLQLVEESPSQPQHCRLVLLTNDSLLSEAVKFRIAGRNNVQVFASSDELKGLINTLMSTVPEDYVARLQVKAKEYFVKDTDNQKGLFYEMKVRDAVLSKCESQLEARPEGTDSRSNGTWYVPSPRFLKKEGQRVFWATRFSIETKAYKEISRQPPLAYEHMIPGSIFSGPGKAYSLPTPSVPVENPPVNLVGVSVPSRWYGGAPIMPQVTVGNLSLLAGDQRLAATGKTVIDVNWSVSVNIKGAFSKPKIDSIEFVETTWENVI
jgi:hypothetical protein